MKICPRCKRPISYIERHRKGDRVYVVAVHYEGYERLPNGKIKKKVRKCYLGPEGSYVHVTKLHVFEEGLVLKGLTDRDRALEYLDALIRYISSGRLELDVETALKLAEKFEKLSMVLRQIAALKRKATIDIRKGSVG